MTLQAVTTLQSSSQPVCPQGLTADISQINHAMDREAGRRAASEDFLQSQLESLLDPGLDRDPDYWPTLARLAELTLFSAGSLALAGDFAACGDLLINPPVKLLHIKDRPQPLALKRHGAITRQVAHLVPTGWQTIEWLKQQTFLEKPHQALLPRLREYLDGWPRPGDYLKALDRDWQTLAGSLGLLMSLATGSASGPQEGWARLLPAERRSLESRVFHPNLRRFRELGRMIAQIGCGD